ncbi:LPS assembly protein LptD [Vibrio marisflavi]|uniref:LPS-assembly protein LptD n=1 Tax=Vibrio marisflavi CECT 7928 TaxID=634439 RepID=A0ABM9A7A4_9VIBR|nr:LPS assembly protein LptD [Vibrio marisflavi]CAH0541529.1 LPS-assembly protein LptD [Vibrio marisflavi CECT 7928]
MPRFSRTLLAASITTALFVSEAHAEASLDKGVQDMPAFGQCQVLDPIDQCLVNVPAPKNAKDLPVNVNADNLQATNNNKATYSGNVVVTQGHKRITADNVTYHKKENVVVATGDVNFSDGQLKAVSDKATDNLNTNQFTLSNTKYNFLCEPGRGTAVYVSNSGKALYQIDDGSITSCPEGNDAWRLRASSIDINKNDEEATFYNPRFEIQNVPVFYLPYLVVPIGKTRKTGFLYPSVSYGSTNGFTTEVPIYWNLAPNYDLTTNIKNMQERGTQLDSKFRYLSTYGSGTINSEYLPSDKKYPDKGARWGVQYTHSGIFEQNWKFNIDYSKVSDIDYFSDLDSSIGTRSDGQLTQEAEATYRSNNWDASILARSFQILNSSSQPYKLLPQLSFNYYQPQLLKHLDFNSVSELSNFTTQQAGEPSATRLHVEPGITIPFSNTWGTWKTNLQLPMTYYYQHGWDSSIDSSTSDLKQNVTRVLPVFSSDAKVVLESNNKFLDEYTQTLEPEVKYVYIPDVNQDDIGLYDSTQLETDYDGLFRTRKYSGYDRYQGANQITYGATSRFFDDDYVERANIAFGQILYLNKGLRLDSTSGNESSFSAWALQGDFNYADDWFYHGNLQYDSEISTLQTASTYLEYRFDGGFIQSNYRYVNKDYISNNVSYDTDSITVDGISQAGLLGSYKLSRKWSATGQYFYDLTTDSNIEWVAGLKYTSDCWYIAFTYSNQVKSWNPSVSSYPNAVPEYENNFGINFGIIGFGTSVGSSSSATGLVDGASTSLSYTNPFFLNN